MRKPRPRTPLEIELVQNIRLQAPVWNGRLFRNNTGMLRDGRGRPVRFGLAVGSSDLIGWTMIHGQAIFTAIEVKRPGGRPTPAQQAFLKAVRKDGGIGLCVSSMEEVMKAIGARRALPAGERGEV